MMIRKFCAYSLLFVATLFTCSRTIAQAPAKTASKTAAKFKPPVVKTLLGNLSGSTAVAGVEEAKNLISQPLKIADSKNSAYTVASYQFTYKRIGITEDEETGKTSPQSDIVSRQFDTTPLPEVWQTNIAESLHSGESLYFFDIIVLDKLGRRFFAPELKITIQ
ncbi:hypothetical protein [Ferruginibacter sp.]|uniref:hypothetical protein n=1 Tax=Ferruginibacter sp. TaxID=1940288 RepID=UPI00265B0922|nr:hypothetical protein [Ferruginibacter sp.]